MLSSRQLRVPTKRDGMRESERQVSSFLDLLSEETVVLIGMLADAVEENLQLVRKLDSEQTT